MGVQMKQQAPADAAPEKGRKKKGRAPQKRTMNLFYKPDRTTKPATVALYVLFVLVVMLGLAKLLVYDLWLEVAQARQAYEAVERQVEEAALQTADYDEVRLEYVRYAATEEEQALLDRIQVLELLDSAAGEKAAIGSISISGMEVTLQFSGVTLAEAGEIANRLEESPLVEYTLVHTAATREDGGDLVTANIFIQLQKEGVGEE